MKRLGARPQCWGVFSPERGSVPLSEPVFRGKTWGEGRRRRSRSTRCLGACPAGPPTALPSLPCRRPPPRGVSSAGTPAPPRGPPAAVAAAAARTGAAGPAGVATRPSLRGQGAEAGAADREGAAFNPAVAQPPGRTRLPVSTPLGGWGGRLSVSTGRSGSSYNLAPIRTPARCGARSHPAVGPSSSPSPTRPLRAVRATRSCEPGARAEIRCRLQRQGDTGRQTETGLQARTPRGSIWGRPG